MCVCVLLFEPVGPPLLAFGQFLLCFFSPHNLVERVPLACRVGIAQAVVKVHQLAMQPLLAMELAREHQLVDRLGGAVAEAEEGTGFEP